MAAIRSISANILRSMLTTVGIVIGVCSIITVVTIMEALGQSVTGQLRDMGTDMITLQAHTPPDQEMLGLTSKITYEDYLAVKNKIPGFLYIAARMRAFSLGLEVRYGKNSTQTQIIGTESDYQNIVSIYPSLGRFVMPQDDQKRRRVVVLGTSVIDKLGLPDNPINEFVKIGDDWFRVIGVAEKRGSLFGFDQDNYIIAPYSTIRSVIGADQTDSIDVVFLPKPGHSADDLTKNIRQFLRSSHQLEAHEADFFEFETAEKTRRQFSSITGSITAVGVGVVAISLLVGGIGVMNIMLVSVTERTREIGIVKALGAPSSFVLGQFLLEALLLALIGGLFGVILGYALSTFIVALLPSTIMATVPLWGVACALIFCAFVGLVFGLAPAIKASKLTPIDALKHE